MVDLVLLLFLALQFSLIVNFSSIHFIFLPSGFGPSEQLNITVFQQVFTRTRHVSDKHWDFLQLSKRREVLHLIICQHSPNSLFLFNAFNLSHFLLLLLLAWQRVLVKSCCKLLKLINLETVFIFPFFFVCVGERYRNN